MMLYSKLYFILFSFWHFSKNDQLSKVKTYQESSNSLKNLMVEMLIICNKMTKNKNKKSQGTYSKMFSIQNSSRRETNRPFTFFKTYEIIKDHTSFAYSFLFLKFTLLKKYLKLKTL